MLALLKKLFGGKKEETTVEVPYKIETPSPVAEQATQAVVESIAPVAAKKKPAPKKKAAPKTAPAEKKPTPKKPRAPRSKA
jgi:hypothetical protein